ncbi:MAG: hypothetical protein Q4C72_00655 [Eubacteriales bacterium]|nr:hypothetical protein [Eubacteriales bacterium]
MNILVSVLPSLLTALCMALFNRTQARRDKETAARAQARKQESLLALGLQMATAKLSYATAMALKRGVANGEVEEGIEAYEQAKASYVAFLNQQAADHLA